MSKGPPEEQTKEMSCNCFVLRIKEKHCAFLESFFIIKTFQFKLQKPPYNNLRLTLLELNYSIWLRTKNQENLMEREQIHM